MTTVRSLRANSAATVLLAATWCLASGAGVSAHREDEFLQAARIGLEPGRVLVELDMTPGIAIAERVIRDIDSDRDGVLSPAEQQRYAERVLGRVALRVDDAPPLRVSLAASIFPDVAAMRTGDAAIRLRLEAPLPAMPSGTHRIVFRNDHTTAGSVYLANALVPESDRIEVTSQDRDVNQRELTIAFALRDTDLSSHRWAWMGLAYVLTLAAPLARRTGGRVTAVRRNH